MTSFIFSELAEFSKEFKKLKKKYPSLDGDLEEIKAFIETFPEGVSNNIVRISDLWEKITIPIYKVRKMWCAYLKSNKAFRLIYALKESSVELVQIEFIEMYGKADKVDHDLERIRKYYEI